MRRSSFKGKERAETTDNFVAADVELSAARCRLSKFFPILEWLPEYRWREFFPADFAGGITIGCVLMAQSVAHAELSGVSLIHGPYSCVVPPLVYMVLGSSHHGSVGTGGLVALVTGTEMARYKTEEERTQAAIILAMLVGLIMVMMGILRLAALVRFMSRPALSGFITGSALLIAKSQLPGALGLPSQKLIPMVSGIMDGTNKVSIPTLTMSCCILLVLMNFKRLAKVVPLLAKVGEFKEILVMATVTAICFFQGSELGIRMIGPMPTGLPTPSMPIPDSEMVRQLAPGAFLLALIIFISSFAAAKKIGMLEGYAIDARSELLGLGFANVFGACCGAIPTQIGLSRTGIAYASGSKSQVGTGLVTSCVVALSLLFLTPLFFYMPKCALNCVIIAAAKSLLDWNEPMWLYSLPVDWRDHKDLCVWVTAFAVTLGWGATHGMFSATALSLLLLVLEVTEPNLSVLARQDNTERWGSCQDVSSYQDPSVLVARIDGILFYANVERFQEQIEGIIIDRSRKTDVHSVILDFSCVPFVDSTVLQVLREMIASWKRQEVEIRIAHAVGRTRKVLEKELANHTEQSNFRMSIKEAYDELVAMHPPAYVPPGDVQACAV